VGQIDSLCCIDFFVFYYTESRCEQWRRRRRTIFRKFCTISSTACTSLIDEYNTTAATGNAFCV
jgi:hypothetical protein